VKKMNDVILLNEETHCWSRIPWSWSQVVVSSYHSATS